MTHVIPVGTSEPQDFALRDDGAAIDGTGLDVELEIYTRVDGEMVQLDDDDDPPVAEWLDQVAGTVRVTGCESLEIDNYFVRYKLTDGAGNIGFCPNGAKADLWKVVAIPAL